MGEIQGAGGRFGEARRRIIEISERQLVGRRLGDGSPLEVRPAVGQPLPGRRERRLELLLTLRRPRGVVERGTGPLVPPNVVPEPVVGVEPTVEVRWGVRVAGISPAGVLLAVVAGNTDAVEALISAVVGDTVVTRRTVHDNQEFR